MTGRAPEAGETLIEILLSIMILGIAVSALLFGMGTAATTSGLHSRQTLQAETLRNVVAALQFLPYVNCASAGQYVLTSSGLVPAGYNAAAVVDGWASGTTFAGTCPGTGDEGTQKVTVTVSLIQADDRVRNERVTVVKRKPCPAVPC